MEDGDGGEHREGVRGALVSYTGKNDQSASGGGGGSSGLVLALLGQSFQEFNSDHTEVGGDGT